MNLDDLSQSKSDGDKDDSVLSGGSIHKDEAISSLTPLDLFLQDLDKNTALIPRCQEVIDIQMGVENLSKRSSSGSRTGKSLPQNNTYQ